VLVENDYGAHGEYVSLDVNAMRTQRDEVSYRHLENSLAIVKRFKEKAARFDYAFRNKCVAARNYEALEMYVMELLMGLGLFENSG
jgi:xylose isomerase